MNDCSRKSTTAGHFNIQCKNCFIFRLNIRQKINFFIESHVLQNYNNNCASCKDRARARTKIIILHGKRAVQTHLLRGSGNCSKSDELVEDIEDTTSQCGDEVSSRRPCPLVDRSTSTSTSLPSSSVCARTPVSARRRQNAVLCWRACSSFFRIAASPSGSPFDDARLVDRRYDQVLVAMVTNQCSLCAVITNRVHKYLQK